jgi:hypothetical protein
VTPPHSDLTDTGKELVAATEEAAAKGAAAGAEAALRRAGQQTPAPTEKTSMEKLILEHEKECRERGPVHELRADVSSLKAWVKGVGIAIAILQLLNAYGQFASRVGSVPIPTAARAETR